jgi:hypothetical protein
MIDLYYEKVFNALNKSKIKYLVVGGIAVNLYGLIRLTRDLDLMIDISEENLAKFVHLMKALGYGTKLSVSEWQDKVAIAFRNAKDESKQIDIFMKNPIDFGDAYKKRKIFKLGRTEVACVGFEDLLKMKEIAGRDRDLIDMGYLKKYRQEGKI